MPVTASDRALAERLVTQYRNARLAKLINASPEVRANVTKRWEIRPPEVTVADVAELERHLPAPLPPLLVAYLTCCAFSGVEWAEFTLPSTATGKKLDVVRLYLLGGQELWPCGYMQFAAGPCADPTCFDIQQLGPKGEYPVVVFNHDLVPHEAWRQRESLQPYVQLIAPSFTEFLTILCTGGDPLRRRRGV